MDFPKLHNGQYAVLKATLSPALFLGLGPEVDIGGARWSVFDSLIAARDYATAAVNAQPSLECGIYDACEFHLQTLRS
jgi:hypothetical protein